MVPEPTATHSEHYVQVNDLTMFYEEHGAGEPLVLVHGGLATSQSWAAHIPAFAQHFRVLVPDSRGHGRTANPTGALSYRLLADDIAAFVHAVGLTKPRICGYSDGGQIALEIGMRYPDLAGALIVGGAWFKFSDTYRTTVQTMGFEGPGAVNPAQIESSVPHLVALMREWHAPLHGPDYWKTLAHDISTMWLTPLGYTAEDFQRVVAPTLVLLGDRDEFIPVEEAAEMYRLLPRAELAICSGADHLFPFVKAELFTTIVLDFLLRLSTLPEAS